ncbi:DUF3833 domain-containing protein [Pseudoalteromonas sp. MT33b]|jgi:hypothetical protein|uniref:DUF3833 domain-containing protein n=1 Tax=Pseudoalteromonas sp. MT33b TaxID=2759705 RepID=UPI0015F9AF6F|nr:DUF3833 domain-containing protein [Pseudoalteromonas sp. MT33b]QMW16387.1 DUF3833 domain-containing protein [Pseudoalteromonas sp. MT33b]
MIKLKAMFISAMVFLVASCSAPDVDYYKGTEPEFNFKRFFSGELKAYGVVQDHKGELTRKLVVDMQASWQGSQGVIDEQFVYDDGETQTRTWYITLNDDGSISGTASDVVGEAKGDSNGSVFHWTYSVELPYNDSTLVVNFDDWMYLVTQSRLINRTAIDKFGVEVGEVTLVIEKIE